MEKIDSLIFDLDGTLWSTLEVCASAWNQVVDLDGFDIPKVTANDIRTYMGLTIPEIENQFFSGHDRNTRHAFFQQYLRREVEALKETPGQLYPGVEEGLPKLADKYSLYLVSNCQREYLDQFMSFTKFSRLFKDNLCYGDTNTGKGENLKAIIKNNEMVSPIYIGDTLGDEVACADAQIPFIFVTYGFGHSHQHEFSVDSFEELCERLL